MMTKLTAPARGHDLVDLQFVEGNFCSAQWCRQCGAVVQGPLGGGGKPLYNLWHVVGKEPIRVPHDGLKYGPPPRCDTPQAHGELECSKNS